MEDYNKLRNYLEHKEIYLDQGETEDLMNIAIQQNGYESNEGYLHKRVEHNEREMAFYKEWLAENRPMPGINSGQGILQDLFIESASPVHLFTRRWITEITPRDRMIAATVIQWLGSNCGMAFLGESLKKFKARIVYDK